MNKSTFQFDFKELKINVAQIESAIGYKIGESHETVSECISEVLKEVETICKIKAEYRISDNIAFKGIHFTLNSKPLILYLAFFLCTMIHYPF